MWIALSVFTTLAASSPFGTTQLFVAMASPYGQVCLQDFSFSLLSESLVFALTLDVLRF